MSTLWRRPSLPWLCRRIPQLRALSLKILREHLTGTTMHLKEPLPVKYREGLDYWIDMTYSESTKKVSAAEYAAVLRQDCLTNGYRLLHIEGKTCSSIAFANSEG